MSRMKYWSENATESKWPLEVIFLKAFTYILENIMDKCKLLRTFLPKHLLTFLYNT